MPKKRRSRALGSTKAIHVQQAHRASEAIDPATINAARNGRCQAALMRYADMQRALGAYNAHVGAGGNAWKNPLAAAEAAHEFNDRCVIVAK
jgi:hypothetical protein